MAQDNDNDVVPPVPDDEENEPLEPPDNPVPEDDRSSADYTPIDGTAL